MANVLLRRSLAVGECHWWWQVEINGCLADDGEDVISILECISTIRFSHCLIRNAGPDGAMEGRFRFRTTPRKYPPYVAS